MCTVPGPGVLPLLARGRRPRPWSRSRSAKPIWSTEPRMSPTSRGRCPGIQRQSEIAAANWPADRYPPRHAVRSDLVLGLSDTVGRQQPGVLIGRQLGDPGDETVPASEQLRDHLAPASAPIPLGSTVNRFPRSAVPDASCSSRVGVDSLTMIVVVFANYRLCSQRAHSAPPIWAVSGCRQTQ